MKVSGTIVILCSLAFAVVAESIGCSESCGVVANLKPTCLGTISPETGFASNGSSFNTANGAELQQGLTCGSQQIGLQTVLLQFEVETSGLYTIETANIGNGDPVMQLMACSGQIVGCNDEADNTTHNARLQLTLQSGTQYLIAISKYVSYSDDVRFDLLITPDCSCRAFTPNQCFGTKQDGFDLIKTQLTLDGTTSQTVLSCGSSASGLNDFVFHFRVQSTGVYSISTQNIGRSDTTMAVYTCDHQLVGCNDDVGTSLSPSQLSSMAASTSEASIAIPLAASNSVRSQVIANLMANVDYVGVVTKFNTETLDPTFDLVIAPDTPTSNPQNGGASIGVIVGPIVAIVVIAALAAFVVLRRRSSSSPLANHSMKDDSSVISFASFRRRTGQFEYGMQPGEQGNGQSPVESVMNRKTGQFECGMKSSESRPGSARLFGGRTSHSSSVMEDWKRQSVAVSKDDMLKSDNPLFSFQYEDKSEEPSSSSQQMSPIL